MKRSELAGQALMYAAVLCAITITGLRLWDHFHAQTAAAAPRSAAADTVRVKDWRKYAAVGHRMGPANAPVTVVEFADFECPFCGRFSNGALQYVLKRHPADVQVVVRQWPLVKIHKFAYLAARAAECAGAQGRFDQIYQVLYAKQDSLGLKPFPDYARDAGVPDSSAFRTCVTQSAKVPAIEADMAAALELGARGTPTLLINGLMVKGAPDSARFESLVEKALRDAH